jgi:hypothetical protein
MLFPRFFSVDSPKAVKAQKYGWLNAISYMAPHRLAGVGNLCPHASTGCIALCLGEHSGNAALYPAVLKSRIAKAQLVMQNRQAFLKEMTAGVAVVFAGAFPAEYLGFPVINGDAHDLRHLDGRGVVVALSPKGRKAKADKSGFIVREAA